MAEHKTSAQTLKKLDKRLIKLTAQTKESDQILWLVTYSDIITLLLVFFVLLLGSSVVDQSKYERLVESIHESSKGAGVVESPFTDFEEKLQAMIVEQQLEDSIRVEKHPLGIIIDLSSESLYASGRSEIKRSSLPVMDSIIDAIKELNHNEIQIEIEGHTDDDPINTARFASNWELSISRAINVLQYFIWRGLEEGAMKIAGYGDTRPKAPNRDGNGVPIKENQAKNRRIEINVFRKEERYKPSSNVTPEFLLEGFKPS